MSREIKFRAWDTENEIYLEPDEAFLIADKGLPARFSQRFGYTSDEELVIEQFTGLLDRNGREIYEGDILGNEWGNGYISWCDKCKQFQYYIFGECMACSGDVQWYELAADDGKLEVIGNIHENPALLGGEE